MDVDPWTPVDDPASRVRKAIPGARITSERRTPQRNAAVGGAPNSAHLSGFAADFVPPTGQSPAAVEAALRRQGGFDQIIYEGNHVHYSDDPRGRGQVFGMQGGHAPDPWAPVQAAPAADPWAPVQGATTPAPTPRPASAVSGGAVATPRQNKAATAAPQPSLMDRAGRYAREEVQSQIVDPWKVVANDFTHPYKAPPVHNPWDVVRGIAGQTKRNLQDAGDLAGAVMNTAGGELIHAGVTRPLAEAGSNIPMPAQPGKKAPNRQQREQILEQDIGTAMLGLGPEGGRIAPKARGVISTEPRLPAPKVRRPASGGPTLAAATEHPEITQPHPVIGDEPDPVTRVDNALYRLGGHSTAGRIEAQQAIRAAPKAVKSAAVQEELTHAIEERMLDRPASKRWERSTLRGTNPRGGFNDPHVGKLSRYADRMYRETSPDMAAAMTPGTHINDSMAHPNFLSNDPAMALGQGDNRGVLLEYDAAGLEGHPNVDKPGLSMAAKNGSAEFRGYNNQRMGMRALRAVRVPDADLGKNPILDRSLRTLEQSGWTRRTQDGYTEWRHPSDVVKQAELPEHLQEAEAVRQPWAERQRTAINEVREKLAARGATEDELAEYAPDTGYVPRRVVGKSPGIDPTETQRSSPLAIQQSKRGLSRATSSLRQRDQIILQFEDGTRRFEHRNASNDEWKPGMTVRDPLTGKPAEVKQATIKEIEGAGARDRNGQPITYHKNALVNTIDEALKAERVNRNIDVLDELTKGLKEQGLAHQNEWHSKNDAGEWVRHPANSRAPDNFQEIPHLPQLKGWSFSPEIAQTLKDYYPGPGESLDNVLSVVNRTLNASLFITPFPHIKNVGTMGFIGRGWDWLPTGANYGRLMTSGRDAIKEVLTLGPKYKEFLREGAGMQAGDDATRNFYQTLLESASEGIAKDPKIAAATGLNPIEMGKALYAASHKILWNVNDMVMLQRYLELQSKGMSKRQAIAETEKWIANYRIPPQVMKSRALAQVFKDGNIVNFGRYTYGKWRAIGEMAKGMTSKNPAERMDALGKVVAMGVMGLIIYPLMDEAAKKITGNAKAKVGRGGELGMVDAALDPEKDQAAKLASVLTPAPASEEGLGLYYNRDLYTGRHIREPQSTALGQGVQVGEHVADQFYPASLGMEAMKPGGGAQAAGRLVGVNLPPEGRDARVAKAKRYERRGALKREAKDEIEALVKSGFR